MHSFFSTCCYRPQARHSSTTEKPANTCYGDIRATFMVIGVGNSWNADSPASSVASLCAESWQRTLRAVWQLQEETGASVYKRYPAIRPCPGKASYRYGHFILLLFHKRRNQRNLSSALQQTTRDPQHPNHSDTLACPAGGWATLGPTFVAEIQFVYTNSI